MYNTELPRYAELPTTGQLLRSTLLATIAAAAILVTVVLPSEYNIDPTGAGRVLGLTEMGAIKTQLAQEAAADAEKVAQEVKVPSATAARAEVHDRRLDEIERQLDEIVALIKDGQGRARSAAAPRESETTEATQTAEAEPAPPENAWREEVSFVLTPGQGIELKLVMAGNAEAEFEWTANGSVLNFDLHGDGNGQSVMYEKGRGESGDMGVLRAAFTGNHGWFWRNRTDENVTLTLRIRGNYIELKRKA